MFESTLPYDNAELMRVSDFRRLQQESAARATETIAGVTRLTSLSATLLEDLKRFEPAAHDGDGLEALEVLAASIRHGRSLLLHLQHQYRVVPLTVFPAEGSLHCTLPMPQLLGAELSDVRVLHVEPAWLRPQGSSDTARIGDARHYAPLSPLLWELALRGARESLLPEIAGPAAYRVVPGSGLRRLGLTGTLGAAVDRLRGQVCNVREIASWPGFDHERATRLLNGLYLQAALMVIRTHPAAINEDHVSHPS
ncbi:MAG: hypothetical protein Q7S90_05990 [Rubrivivax sp.]|nr:hypothetical protein [Rubrivivax sp.]